MSEESDMEPMDIDFGESEYWTRTTLLSVEKWDEISREKRCDCGAIGEYTMRMDLISDGDEQELDVCARCLAKYTHMFDRENIFRSQRGRDFPDRYC